MIAEVLPGNRYVSLKCQACWRHDVVVDEDVLVRARPDVLVTRVLHQASRATSVTRLSNKMGHHAALTLTRTCACYFSLTSSSSVESYRASRWMGSGNTYPYVSGPSLPDTDFDWPYRPPALPQIWVT